MRFVAILVVMISVAAIANAEPVNVYYAQVGNDTLKQLGLDIQGILRQKRISVDVHFITSTARTSVPEMLNEAAGANDIIIWRSTSLRKDRLASFPARFLAEVTTRKNRDPIYQTKISGQAYGIPIMYDYYGLAYNKDVTDRYGVAIENNMTWNDIIRISKKIESVGDGTIGLLWSPPSHPAYTWVQLIRQLNGQLGSTSADLLKQTWSQAHELNQIRSFRAPQLLTRGKAAFAYGTIERLGFLAGLSYDPPESPNIIVVDTPMVDPASKYTPVDYWVISVTDKGTTKPETWDVVRSLVHAQADMWALTGLIPINATPAIVARLTGDTVRTDVGDMVPVNMNPRGQKEEEQEQLLVTAYEEIAADPRVLTDIVAKVKGSLDRL